MRAVDSRLRSRAEGFHRRIASIESATWELETMGDLNHPSVIDPTTVGRSTGRPHTIEIWFAALLESNIC